MLWWRQHQMLDQRFSSPECLISWTQNNSVRGYCLLKRKKNSFSSHFYEYLVWGIRRGKVADSCVATKCQGFYLSSVSSFHHIITCTHTHTLTGSKNLSSAKKTDMNEPQRHITSIWTQLPQATRSFPRHTCCPGIHPPLLRGRLHCCTE